MTYIVPTYECENSCCIQQRHVIEDQYTGELYCKRCDYGDVTVTGQRPAEFVSVAVYEVEHLYGGSEEGGWYYESGRRLVETLRNFASGDFPQVRCYIETLRNRWPAPNYSVELFEERLAPEHTPDAKPVYS